MLGATVRSTTRGIGGGGAGQRTQAIAYLLSFGAGRWLVRELPAWWHPSALSHDRVLFRVRERMVAVLNPLIAPLSVGREPL